ncbi:MAG: polysaccharide deacetylase family protein [Butyricicoccus pullicaecorum]|nr:polysaccharide deacetylase family protein [Butyricicoccus pullicaecorum]
MRHSRLLFILLSAFSLAGSASALSAVRSHEDIYIYGNKANLSAYTVSRNNYVRARDFAKAAGCSVYYDPNTSSIFIDEGQPYDASAESQPPATAPKATARPTLQTVYINGKAANIKGYSIDGYNYFALRDLGRELNWSVLYNSPQKRVEVDPTFPYFQKNKNTVIFMYHAFTNDPAVLAANPNLYTSPWKLRCDIRDMRAMGYTCISLEDYFNGKAEKGKKYFIITIDDGYLDNYQLAYPVLVEEKAPASIFTVVREMERETPTFFNAQQAREMEASGYIKVYAHNIDHIDCTEVDAPELNKELKRAYTSLNSMLGQKTLFFAYPYGAHNTDTYINVRNNGFRLQLVQERKFAADDVLVRKNVRYDSDMSVLVRKAYHN